MLTGPKNRSPSIVKVGPPGFEPESIAPEATRIPSYPTGPSNAENPL